MGPGTIGLAATQLNLFVNTLLATSQGTGAPSWLSYAFRLMYLPIGLFGVSIATAVLPAAARHAAVDDHAAVRQTLSRGLGLMLVAERAGHARPRRARHAHRAAAVRARAVPAVGHHGDGGRRCSATPSASSATPTARIVSPVFYALGQQPRPGR